MRRFAGAAAGGGGLTLARKLDSVWEGLLAAGVAACPVCGGSMRREAERGRCGGCGSVLR
jgi:ribosomal protein S27AE